ncbi:helicase C-terminal domain-containing protein [Podospora didyma]|uniref:ATP-dependent DNA helicase CHL1 n=1 Tax=Podospora didyma TaxID=330526 RepID=A0AAE0K0Z4_9PEZI|nr:helicase C-terminal domain-containing protein [Podospora didyma]
MTSTNLNPCDEPMLDFHHPYTPYDVQLQFMRAAYDVLEKGDRQVGILESPTGTGKSLSLICSALTWLRNHKRNRYEATFDATAASLAGEPDWMIESALRRKRQELTRQWEEREARLERVRAREKALEERGRDSKRQRLDHNEDDGGHHRGRGKRKELDEEAEFLIAYWEDGTDDDPLSNLSKETRALLNKVGLGGTKKVDEEDDEVEDDIKIYYTSRTHSQLTQFISELRRPEFPPSIPSGLLSEKHGRDAKDTPTKEVVKQLPLSSRQKLCINPSVSRLGSLAAINDRCSELQQSTTKCAFMPSADNLKQTHQFRDEALAIVPDIEDMYRIGKQLQICPYYASRKAIPAAEVITLPYPLLLQRSAREALGIKLEGNIVIIDEAHNIMDAVANVHAAEIRLSELRRAKLMLIMYVKRFGKKLKGENRVMVTQVVRVLEALSEWLDETLNAQASQGIADPNTLLKTRGADQINLYKLIKYIQESKLAYKVESYVTHTETEAHDSSRSQKSTPSTPVLHTLVSFLTALTNLTTEGRIFFEKLPGTAPPDIKLSYLLLSPTHAFSSIASSARAVILAGGTMSPFDDYKAHLFPTLSPDKITTMSCGHVIPSSNLCVWTLASTLPVTTTNKSTVPVETFEFSFQKRSDRAMVMQFGLALLNICSVVPDGVVVFFPSYGYLDEVVQIWQHQQTSDSSSSTAAPPPAKQPIWDRLVAKKALFRETKGGSSDEVLQNYTQAILSPVVDNDNPRQKGALLLSVVGGKMSEGINFSDRLGRCVVIVGLPYPNMHSAEWKARIEHIKSSTLTRLLGENDTPSSSHHLDPPATTNTNSTGVPEPLTTVTKLTITRDEATAQATQAARDFYENACMRAVNQSIGRAIRHRGDYAAIVLVDRRFGTDRIRGKLPDWIQGGMVAGSEGKGMQGLMGALSGFFRGKREEGL